MVIKDEVIFGDIIVDFVEIVRVFGDDSVQILWVVVIVEDGVLDGFSLIWQGY